MKTSLLLIRGFLLVVSLLVAACGSDDGGGSATIDPVEQRIDEIFPEEPSYGMVNRAQVRRMLELAPEDDAPFYMINLIRYRERAEYPDGRPTDLTGREADNIYNGLVLPILLDIGALPVFVAEVERNIVDPDGAEWEQVAIALYPSRAEFLAMLEREDFVAAAIHKDAGVEQSSVLVSNLSPNQLPDELRRVDLSALRFPPTDDDPPMAIVHLYRFNEIAQYPDGRPTDLTGREAMMLYSEGRSAQGVFQLGIRPGLILDVEDELIGDGRSWDEFHINNFPSRATFAEVATEEVLAEAGIEHRQAALAEAYSLMADPLLNSYGYE